MSTGTISLAGKDVSVTQIGLIGLIIILYLFALFALPAIIEPVLLGLPFWAWILMAIVFVHYLIVYKFIQDYRDLDQVVSGDG